MDIESFWQVYLHSLPAGQNPTADTYDFWHFCDNEKGANELAKLTLQGSKTATSSLLWAYEAEGETVPQAGALSIITDWEGVPVCLIRTVEVRVRAFNEVDERVAFDEGEGDRSLAYWRRVHWEAFSRECAEIGRQADETMPVVNEWFEVLFPPLQEG
ncbi:MAG: ASCH domain-containing protein [Anaerolineales bacterium]|nr:ASCH domain-containing protein [Anaerolineales bacterium]